MVCSIKEIQHFSHVHISDKLVVQSLLLICYVLLFTTVCLALFFEPLFVLL